MGEHTPGARAPEISSDVGRGDPRVAALLGQMARVSDERASLTIRPLATLLSLRASESVRSQVAHALALAALPGANTSAQTPWGQCLWMRPDEWLLAGNEAIPRSMIDTLTSTVSPDDGAVVDVSDSRLRLELSGPASRDVLASCCPLDLHPLSFYVGRCAQSLVAKAPVLVHLVDDTPRWQLYVRPSLTAYVVAWLTDAMATG